MGEQPFDETPGVTIGDLVPLTWHNSLVDDGVSASAFGIRMFYRIVRAGDTWDLVYPYVNGGLHYDQFHETQASAKRAAEADRLKRVAGEFGLVE